jgi:glyoxylase-like metal-dependent hydrolase (beta-lactamase superfamily II)
VSEELRRISYPEVDERITALGYTDEVDAFIVRTERYTVLIDTLSTPRLGAAAAELVGADQRLLVVNTHADWDHVWGNAAVTGRAPIIAHAAALDRLRAPAARTTLADKARAEPRFRDVQIVEPTVTFTDTLTIAGGDLTLELIHTPGHTPDHVVVWIPELRIVLAGDAVEDPLPELWDDTPASLHLMRTSLEAIQALGAKLVLPSHGRTTDPGIIARNLAYFDDLTGRVGDLIAAELPPDELADSHGLRFGDVFGADQNRSAAAERFYRQCHARAVLATAHQCEQNRS